MRSSLLRYAALIGALALSTSALRAQSSRVLPRDEGSPRTPTRVISVNPFLPLLGYFQGEYEHRVAGNASIGISGAHMKMGDLYTSLDVKLRLYPQERVLQKLGISAGLGYGRVRTENPGYCDDPLRPDGTLYGTPSCDQKRSLSAPTFAVEAQYQWLLGTNRATAVAIGGGVKRFFLEERETGTVNRVVPTLRLTIGYAF
jgi:hypothetical protein